MNDETQTKSDGPPNPMQVWLEMARQMTEASQAWTGAAVSPDAMRQGRANVHKMWSESWERLLRSGSFLEAQKQYMAGGTELQKQAREYLAWLHHELQLPSSQDIDQLMIGVRRLKEEIRDQFEELGGRLDTLSGQITALASRFNAMEQKISAPGSRAAAERMVEAEAV